MDRNFDHWEQAAFEPNPQMELKNIRRNLRKRNWKTIAISLALVSALLLGTVKVVIPAAEGLFWKPKYISSELVGEYSDLYVTMNTYASLFCPGMNVIDVDFTHTGFATYSVCVEYSTPSNRGHSDYNYLTLEKSELNIPSGYWETVPPNRLGSTMHPENREYWTQLLTQLPEYVQVSAYISFSEDITMQQYEQFRWALIEDNTETINNTGYYWAAIRCMEPTEANASAPKCGLGVYSCVLQEMNLEYPCFNGTLYPKETLGYPVGSGIEGKIQETQFVSLLQYSADMCRQGRGIQVPGYPHYYEDALRYIEKNGVMVYGCFITTTPARLLEIMDWENISSIYPEDGWLNI